MCVLWKYVPLIMQFESITLFESEKPGLICPYSNYSTGWSPE